MSPRDPTSRLVAWGAPVCALAAFVVYALLAGPARDDAWLAGAGRAFAPPPPPVAPLWLAMARVAALLPIGDDPMRLRLLSAVCAALAVLWTGRLATALARVGAEPDAAAAWAGIAAAALLAVALVFERRATAIGVAPATVAALAAAALLIERVASGAGAATGLGLAIVCGLGLGLGPAFASIVPAAAALGVARLRRGARFPLAAPALVVLVAGAVWALAPLRADAHGPHEIGAVARAAVGTSASTPRPLGDLAEELGDSLGPFGVLAAGAGAIALVRRRRLWPAVALASVAVLDAVLTARGDDDATALAWALVVAAGLGVALVVRLTGRFAPAAGAAIAALAVLPAALLSLL